MNMIIRYDDPNFDFLILRAFLFVCLFVLFCFVWGTANADTLCLFMLAVRFVLMAFRVVCQLVLIRSVHSALLSGNVCCAVLTNGFEKRKPPTSIRRYGDR